MYTPSDTRLKWPEEGLLFESDSNECSGGTTEVMLGALGKIWHSPRNKNKCIFHLTRDLTCLVRAIIPVGL